MKVLGRSGDEPVDEGRGDRSGTGTDHGADEIGGGGTRSGDQEMVSQPAGSDRGGEGQTEIFPPDRKPQSRAKGRKR